MSTEWANSAHSPNPTTKQHAVMDIQLNIVTRPTYLEKFIQDVVIAPFLLLSVVIVTLPSATCSRQIFVLCIILFTA